MIKPIALVSAVLAITQAAPAWAESDFQQWLTMSAKADVGETVVLQGEAVARFGNDANGLYELENALLVGFKLDDNVTAWAGYVHNPTYSDGDFVVMERRAREQITADNFAKLGAVSLGARLRFEQRWRDGADGTGWRVRPHLKAAVPLGGKSAPVMNFTAEPFFNLNTTGFQQTSGLDRVRSAVSVTVPLNGAVKLEAGYLNQHRFVRDGQDRGDHALTASLAVSF